MIPFKELLKQSAARHTNLCPRQVLGVRMGVLGCKLLGLNYPDEKKLLVTLMETDGCAADGLSAATGCTIGNRRMRILDYGKVASTFVRLEDCKTIRIVPRSTIREAAQFLSPDSKNSWEAQLLAYQVMPDDELLVVQNVELNISLEKLLSKPGYRVNCQVCGEEIINEREICSDKDILCRSCAGIGYYQLLDENIADRLYSRRSVWLRHHTPQSPATISQED